MMTVYPETPFIIAVLFCLMFFAVWSNAQTADPTIEEHFSTLQEPLKPTRLVVETWQASMKPRKTGGLADRPW